MSIQSTIDAQRVTANEWATSARDTALSALSSLSNVDIPYIQIGQIPFTPLVATDAEIATSPTLISISTPPVIAAIAQVDKPDKPDIDPATLGALLGITLPTVPTIEFPTINITPPVYSITAPKSWDFNISDIAITDNPMVQAILSRLASNITYGGTGLTATIEDAIWNRDLERMEQQLQDSTDKLTSMWAKKGFSLPDGLLANSLSDIQKEYMNKRIDRSREIAIKQAELEQTNIFKSMELGINLSSQLIDMLIKFEELVLRSQEDTAKFANEYIDLQIKTYNSLLDAYKTTAQVQEILIRANLAKVDLYKAELEGQQLIMSINKQTVEVYVEQLRATAVLIDRYKAEVDAMTAELGAERVKIEVNKLQMDAWAKEADVRMSQFSGGVEVFKAIANQNISIADLQGKQAEASLRANLSATELAIKAIEISNKSLQTSAQLKVEAAKGVAQAAGALAAGAMAGVNTAVSESYGESRPLPEGT